MAYTQQQTTPRPNGQHHAAQPVPTAPAQNDFTEAPASINLRFDYRGANIQLTLRESSGLVLLNKLDVVMDHLENRGAVFSGQRSGGNAGAAGESAAGPVCPDGHGPMKPSTKKPGEYFCPATVGNHPQTGKKLYCAHKITA